MLRPRWNHAEDPSGTWSLFCTSGNSNVHKSMKELLLCSGFGSVCVFLFLITTHWEELFGELALKDSFMPEEKWIESRTRLIRGEISQLSIQKHSSSDNFLWVTNISIESNDSISEVHKAWSRKTVCPNCCDKSVTEITKDITVQPPDPTPHARSALPWLQMCLP